MRVVFRAGEGVSKPETLMEFATGQDARDYRHAHGTGGWIFVPDAAGEKSVLFPPSVCPSEIFHHPITRGRSGNLVGAA